MRAKRIGEKVGNDPARGGRCVIRGEVISKSYLLELKR
jgi:hypothetical protein